MPTSHKRRVCAAAAAFAAHEVLNLWFPARSSKHDATLRPYLRGNVSEAQLAAAASLGEAIGLAVYQSRWAPAASLGEAIGLG
jgi:hypothetical protein